MKLVLGGRGRGFMLAYTDSCSLSFARPVCETWPVSDIPSFFDDYDLAVLAT